MCSEGNLLRQRNLVANSCRLAWQSAAGEKQNTWRMLFYGIALVDVKNHLQCLTLVTLRPDKGRCF